MAERRMFAKTVIDSDAFIDMPLSTQALYFHLSMRADDDGFINNPKKIQRMIGCGEDDIKLLIAKKFIIPFDSGVVVIKHWKIHNYIQKDRYKPTVYAEEKAKLSIKSNNAYSLKNECIQDVYKTDTQVRLGKVSIGKISIDDDYCEALQCNTDATNKKTQETNLFNVFEDEFTRPLSQLEYQSIADLRNKYNDDLILYALKLSIKNGVRKLAYIESILNNWNAKGIQTVIEAEEESNQFKNRKNNVREVPEWYKNKDKEEEFVPATQKEIEELQAMLKENHGKEK